MEVTLDRSGAFPKLVFKDRDSYAESDTKKARPRLHRSHPCATPPPLWRFGRRRRADVGAH